MGVPQAGLVVVWRRFLPLALALLFSVNVWWQGDPRTRRFTVLTWGVIGSILAVSFWAEGHPENRVARLLLTSTSGPPSPAAFLRFGAVMLVMLAALMYFLVVAGPGSIQTALAWLMPFMLLPAMMGLAGGIYLLARARLKGRTRD